MKDEIQRARELQLSFINSGMRLEDFLEPGYDIIAIHSGSTVIMANQKGAQQYGYQQDEFVGLNAWLLFSIESAPILTAKLAEQSETPYQAIARRKDGSFFPVEIKAKNFHIAGERARAILVKVLPEN